MPPPSFDTWTSMFLFAAIQGFFVAFALFFMRRKQRRANGLLALLVLLFSITLVEYVLYWTRFQIRFPHTMGMSEGFPFLFGAILYGYFLTVFDGHRWRWRDGWHLLPFVLFLIWMLPQYVSSGTAKQLWMQGQRAEAVFYWPKLARQIQPFWPALKVLSMSSYLLLIWRGFFAASAVSPDVRRWFLWLWGLFLLFICSYVSYFVLVRFPFFSPEWDYMISFSMMLSVYVIAWFGYLQPGVFGGFSLTETLKQPERYRNSAITPALGRSILDRIHADMRANHRYRDSELSLERLADTLQVPKHHLSQVINEQAGMSFFDFINAYRVEEAKVLLHKHTKQELNVIEIAYQVGFNNKATFNNAFKKATGMTATAYRDSKP